MRFPRVAAFALAAGAASALVVGVAHSAFARRSSVATGVVVIDTSLGYEQSAAAGTGMVLTPTGEVLTNNHVIRGATAIRVTVPGTGRSYPARVLGYSIAGDVALLKVNATHLATVTTGGSSALRVGDAVTAVGNAGGTSRITTAAGHVTALRRTITARDDQGDAEQLTGLIETDAALQPGDSGGPLVDASGKVVGMDTAASASFSFRQTAGDGYAIPIARALSLAHQIAAGRASATVHLGTTAFLGVQVASPDAFGGGSGGALVTGVVPGSPAERAGLAAGATITAVAGRSVASPTAVVAALQRQRPGKPLRLGWVDQFGTQQSATVKLASGPPQ